MRSLLLLIVNSLRSSLSRSLSLLVLLVLFYGYGREEVLATPLDDYVRAADPHYAWWDTGLSFHGRGAGGVGHWTGHILNFTSQQWLTEDDVDHSVWWHILVVVEPDSIVHTQNGTLWMTNGDNSDDGLPEASNEDIHMAGKMATQLGIVVGVLFQIPNEPLVFASDPEQRARSEDAAIAYTWDHFLKNPEETEWPLRLPMTKAAVRAMDTLTSFMHGKTQNEVDIQYYSVGGESKRGWTSYVVAAVDERVQAAFPVVLDMINFRDNLHHQWRSYGGWSYALEDYYDMGIMPRIDDPEMTALQYIVDPYFYRDRLTMPMFIVSGTMDDIQQPDDIRYWWDDVSGAQWFIGVPNTDHSMERGRFTVPHTVFAWLEYLLNDWEVPTITWEIDDTTGDITVWTHGGVVSEANVFHATSCSSKRRDFRSHSLDDPCLCGPVVDGLCADLRAVWHKEPLSANEDGTYTAHMDPPENGKFTAFLIDIQFEPYDSGADTASTGSGVRTWPVDPTGALECTSAVSVITAAEDAFPFPDCYGTDCAGTLV